MKVVDLFCGAGGFSHGFLQAGFKVVLGIDNDKAVLETFATNHPAASARLCDIQAVRGSDIIREFGQIDILLGSPPCTNFSAINPKKNREDTSLVAEFFRLVDEINPKYWVMENVKDAEPHIRKFAPKLRADILNAADFGVPQTRVRMFLGNHPSPQPTHTEVGPIKTLDGRILRPWVPLGNILEEDVTWGILSEKRVNVQRRIKSRPGYAQPWPDSLEHPCRTLLASSHKGNQNLIVVKPDGYYRVLTIRELAQLQGFPDSFWWIGSYYAVQNMIGNAVPPPVSNAIARAILRKEGLA